MPLCNIIINIMQKSNKAAVKWMLFFGFEHVYDCSVQKFYFDMELIICIFEVEFVIGV